MKSGGGDVTSGCVRVWGNKRGKSGIIGLSLDCHGELTKVGGIWDAHHHKTLTQQDHTSPDV